MRRMLFVLFFVLAGCPRSEPFITIGMEDMAEVEELAETADFAVQPDLATACTFEAVSTLPGVSFTLEGNRCHYTLAEVQAGVEFTYAVIVEDTVKNVNSIPLDAGFCDEMEPSGLRIFEKIHGNDQQYCLCDEGLCMGMGEKVHMEAGTYEGTFRWEGVNWYGPSDTGNPKGAPFPPGSYTFVIRAEGKYGVGKTFAVNANLEFELIE
jgi:hypothetical protein